MSTKLPLVSIGIPTYNRPSGLRKVLQEVISQTYANIEIIVSDNCSPESQTEAIAREFIKKDPRIKYFRQQQNVGIFNNYRFLLKQAQGEYFAWLCDDDSRHPGYIEACMKEFERLQEVLLVNSYSVRINPRTGETIRTDKGCTTVGMPACDRYIRYISTIYTTQAAVGDILYGVMKREMLTRAMEDQPNVLGWDHVLLGRLAIDGEFYTIPSELMSSVEFGISSNPQQTAKSQLIQGSLSERMPIWVRETYQQQTIRNSPNLNSIEKFYVSIWSYTYYFTTFGIKLWLKRIAPALFRSVRKFWLLMSQQSQACE